MAAEVSLGDHREYSLTIYPHSDHHFEGAVLQPGDKKPFVFYVHIHVIDGSFDIRHRMVCTSRRGAFSCAFAFETDAHENSRAITLIGRNSIYTLCGMFLAEQLFFLYGSTS